MAMIDQNNIELIYNVLSELKSLIYMEEDLGRQLECVDIIKRTFKTINDEDS